jgi:hypothetical protein
MHAGGAERAEQRDVAGQTSMPFWTLDIGPVFPNHFNRMIVNPPPSPPVKPSGPR